MPAEPADNKSGRLVPEAVARRSFGTAFRGYDQLEVRAFLTELAEELRNLRDREAESRLRAEDAEKRAAGDMDDARLAAMLGEETTRIVAAAREAATEIKAKAEETAARQVREAQEEAAGIRTDADEARARLLEETEQAAAKTRDAAESIRAEARMAADGEIEAARERGREMVAEAQAVRERVLQDLSRRRKLARQQLEQLRAGRERLLEAYEVVQRTLDQTTHELRIALPEAKIAAESAARRVDSMPDDELLDVAEVAAMIAAEAEAEAREAGPVDSGPGPDPDAEMVVVLEEVTVEPGPDADGVTTDETASVAVVRRTRRRRRRDADLPEAELMPLQPGEPFEEVRLVLVPSEAAEGVEEADDESAEVATTEVDELFARLRASREEEVAKARDVLAEGSEEAEPEPDTEPELDTEAVDESEPAAASAEETVEAEEGAGEPASDIQSLLERRDAATDQAENALTRRLKRVLADEQNEVLDRLRRAGGKTLADVLPAQDEQSGRYAEAAVAELAGAATSGSVFFTRDDTSNGHAGKAAVDDLADELAGVIVSQLRDRLSRAFSEAGGDSEELADRVRSSYREWKNQRIGDTSRHYVLAAFTRGLFEAQPAGTQLTWVVDDGGAPCPDAEDNALAGLVVKGEPFPTGHCYPPAHPGCRCLVKPEDL